MRLEKLHPGFIVADAEYPSVIGSSGQLLLKFNSSHGEAISVIFSGVPAYHWQEGESPVLSGEPWDGSCELFESEWLSQHAPGKTINSHAGLRHLRFNFNAWGQLEVLCSGFTVVA